LNANHLASIATRPQSTESLHASSAKNDPDGARTLDANRSFRAFRATPTQSAASHRITDFVRIPPASMAFTLLMSFLSALPSFAIDMSLPAITETAASLRVAPAQAGLMMSLFMVGFAVAPLFYGPASDRYGRKPIVVFACMLFVIAGIGCALAQSLPTLLMWRVVQGAGAGASMTIALAIIRDLFEGQAARTKLSYVTIATMIVPMIAPTAGAALLALGGWRVIHAVLAGVGLFLLLAMLLGFAESARINPANRLVPSVIARNYLRVLMHPLCLGYILVSSTTFGALFAYVSGSSLFLINVVGLRPLHSMASSSRRPRWASWPAPFSTPGSAPGGLALLSACGRLVARRGFHNIVAGYDASQLDAAPPLHLTSGPRQPGLRADRAQRDAGGNAALAANCRRRWRRDRLHPDDDSCRCQRARGGTL
jgi:MFS family permease